MCLSDDKLHSMASLIELRAACHSFELHAQGYIDNRNRGFGYSMLDKLKYEVEGLMAKYEVEPNAR